MAIKSLGNTVSSFDNYEVRSGNDASNATNHGSLFTGPYGQGCIFDFDPATQRSGFQAADATFGY